jgi:hypothetical protein
MSWSTHTPDAVAKDAVELDEPQLSDVVEVEQRAQFEAAVVAAQALAKVVGRDGDTVHVSISGHANPDHAPRDGWANEMISVTVSANPAS